MRRTVDADEGGAKRGRQELPLSEESPLTITVNDREVATLLCTARDLHDLTVGWLFAEGLIDGSREIVSLTGCAFDREMLVRTSPDRVGDADRRWRLVTSGCGAGAGAWTLQGEGIPRVAGDPRLTLGRLRELAGEMLRGARLYRLTGGMHSAVLVAPEGLVVQREDIGRHNAVDKVIGYGLLVGLDFRALGLISTGRLTSEMVWKAARAGISVVASLSIPSALARDIAETAGVTLVGRVLAARPWVYTHAGRVQERNG